MDHEHRMVWTLFTLHWKHNETWFGIGRRFEVGCDISCDWLLLLLVSLDSNGQAEEQISMHIS